jgi:ribosomal protein L12E/L44/L45/RPP1/RPP2
MRTLSRPDALATSRRASVEFLSSVFSSATRSPANSTTLVTVTTFSASISATDLVRLEKSMRGLPEAATTAGALATAGAAAVLEEEEEEDEDEEEEEDREDEEEEDPFDWYRAVRNDFPCAGNDTVRFVGLTEELN